MIGPIQISHKLHHQKCQWDLFCCSVFSLVIQWWLNDNIHSLTFSMTTVFSFWNSWAKSDLLVKHLYVFFSSRELDGWILSSGSSGSEISLDPFISFIVSELFPIICNCWLLSRFENYLDFADFERLWRTWTRSQRLSGNSFCDF